MVAKYLKKILIVALLFANVLAHAQEHIKIGDVPVKGSLEEFVGKLKACGICSDTTTIVYRDGQPTLPLFKGKFAGIDYEYGNIELTPLTYEVYWMDFYVTDSLNVIVNQLNEQYGPGSLEHVDYHYFDNEKKYEVWHSDGGIVVLSRPSVSSYSYYLYFIDNKGFHSFLVESQNFEVVVPRFKMYKTENIYNLLKLDTATGKVWQVQISLGDTKDMIVEISPSIYFMPLYEGETLIPGRFELYPTQNMYNFILIDTIDGRCWQVQWNTVKDKRFMYFLGR